MKKFTEDHRSRVTKLLLRRAFTDLLVQKPIQSISVKELCERAGINRGTFYSHYTDIHDLLHQLEQEMLADFEQAMAPLLQADRKELTPVKITAGVFQCLKENADLCTVTLGPHGDKSFALRLINIGREVCLEAYSEYYQNAKPRQIEYFYAFASAGCIGLLQKWLADGMAAPAEEIARIAEDIMIKGMGFLREPEQ